MASAWRLPATSTGIASALKLPQLATSAEGATLGLAGNSWFTPAKIDWASGVVIHSTRALADKQWEGRLCLRTAKKVYNQSLTATLIETHGAAKTEEIVKGWVNNLSTDVFSDDIAVLEAINAGQCDVGIVNTYYYGRLHKQKPNLAVKLFWPNQGDRGVHVNLSGIGLTKHAPHPEAAKALVEWMTTPEAQKIFADVNQEFPANPAVPPSAEVATWGKFVADTLPVEVAGKRQAEAIRLMDRAGWN